MHLLTRGSVRAKDDYHAEIIPLSEVNVPEESSLHAWLTNKHSGVDVREKVQKAIGSEGWCTVNRAFRTTEGRRKSRRKSAVEDTLFSRI